MAVLCLRIPNPEYESKSFRKKLYEWREKEMDSAALLNRKKKHIADDVVSF